MGIFVSFVEFDHESINIYIADQNNHRIIEYRKDATIGQVVAGGSETNRLTTLINAIIDYQNYAFIITDRGNKRVVRDGLVKMVK